MKTYAEAQNEETFDWNKFLNQESYTSEQLMDAKHRSGNWVKCATGNQCDIIPRDQSGEPYDTRLSELGIQFMRQIHKMGPFTGYEISEVVKEAKDTLHRIEARSSFLITQTHKVRILNALKGDGIAFKGAYLRAKLDTIEMAQDNEGVVEWVEIQEPALIADLYLHITETYKPHQYLKY